VRTRLIASIQKPHVPYTIVTLTDKEFVFQEIGDQGTTFTLIRGTKEEVDPE
jgi:hypothetical protein